MTAPAAPKKLTAGTQAVDSSIIEDIISVGGTPAAPNGGMPAYPAKVNRLKVDVAQEFVSGSAYAWLTNYAHVLEASIDDVTVDLGDDLYLRMLYESQIAAAVTIYKASILEDGANLRPAVEDSDADGYEQAVAIHETLEKVIENLSTTLDDVLWDMLDAAALGNRVAELIYNFDSTYTGKSQLFLKSIKVRPRDSTSFVVDSYNNVLGLLVRMPGQANTLATGSVFDDLINIPNFVLREKFAVLTNRPHNNDPRGTSILRPAYDAWWRKQQIKVEYLKYLAQFAGPSLFGTTPENAKPEPITDQYGNALLDQYGNPMKRTTPEAAFQAALSNLRNGSVAVAPHGSMLQPLNVKGNGEAFLLALKETDKEMTRAILTQELATNEGLHSTRAQAQVHQDALDTLIRQGKRGTVRMIRRDVLAGMVKYNWGEQYLPLVPQVTLGDIAEKDFSQHATAVAALQSSGYLDPSQFRGVDAELGLPARDQESIDAAIWIKRNPPQQVQKDMAATVAQQQANSIVGKISAL